MREIILTYFIERDDGKTKIKGNFNFVTGLYTHVRPLGLVVSSNTSDLEESGSIPASPVAYFFSGELFHGKNGLDASVF